MLIKKIPLEIQTHRFVSSYKCGFSNVGLHQKLSFARGGFNEQTFCFDPYI